MRYVELKKSDEQHICIFGEPFTGKSTLASTLSELGFKLLWISFDKGHTVLGKLSQAAQERIELIRVPDTKDFPVGIATANKIMTGAKVRVCQAHGQVDCSVCQKDANSGWDEVQLNSLGLDWVVVFDHITQIAESAMAWTIKKAIKDGEKDATGTVEKDADVFKPGRDQYAIQGFLMNKFLTNMQACRQNVICIAHVGETEFEDGRKKLVPLIGTIPYSRNAPKYFDHIVYCEVTNKSHKSGSVTTYAANVISGSRVDVDINKYLEGGKPTLRPFFEHILKKLKETPAELSVPEVPKVIEEIKENVEQTEQKIAAEVVVLTRPAATSSDASISTGVEAMTSSERAKAMLAKLRH